MKSFKDMFLGEFDREMVLTRKILERVPLAEKRDWMPHAKSMKLGSLAIHVANLVGFAVPIITKDTLTFGADFKTPEIKDTAQLVAFFDEQASAARAALAATDDEQLEKMWSLFFGDKKLMEAPRAEVLRSLFMSHLIHHRAQLGVYLRLNDIAIPGSYGPSADEPM